MRAPPQRPPCHGWAALLHALCAHSAPAESAGLADQNAAARADALSGAHLEPADLRRSEPASGRGGKYRGCSGVCARGGRRL